MKRGRLQVVRTTGRACHGLREFRVGTWTALLFVVGLHARPPPFQCFNTASTSQQYTTKRKNATPCSMRSPLGLSAKNSRNFTQPLTRKTTRGRDLWAYCTSRLHSMQSMRTTASVVDLCSLRYLNAPFRSLRCRPLISSLVPQLLAAHHPLD